MNSPQAAQRIHFPLELFAASSWINRVLVILFGSWMIAGSSWIQVPVQPVPITMQTFAILLVGVFCGSRLGAETVGAYLVQGAIGLPVFAGGGGGIVHFAGPTGGYLVGFLLAAAAVGYLMERGWGEGWLKPLFALIIGDLLVFVPGVLWLSTLKGFAFAFYWGFAIFVVWDLLKILLAYAVTKGFIHYNVRKLL